MFRICPQLVHGAVERKRIGCRSGREAKYVSANASQCCALGVAESLGFCKQGARTCQTLAHDAFERDRADTWQVDYLSPHPGS